jgi:hypothetical protein
LYPNWSVLKELDNELSVQNNISSWANFVCFDIVIIDQ